MEKIGAIADTGFVVALLNRKDRQHVAVATIYQQHPTIALPQPALTEIAYLLGRDAGIPTVVQFLRFPRQQPISSHFPNFTRHSTSCSDYRNLSR